MKSGDILLCMKIELVLFIFFAAVLGPVVITLAYCGIRGCGDGDDASPESQPDEKSDSDDG